MRHLIILLILALTAATVGLASAPAHASGTVIPNEGIFRDRMLTCLNREISSQLPASFGELTPLDPLETISKSDPSVLNFYFATRTSSSERLGWYLKLRIANGGVWRYLQISGTVTAYSQGETSPTAKWVDDVHFEPQAVIDVSRCASTWARN